MVAKPGAFENPHARAAQTPGEWRLILAPKPRAPITLYLTIAPELHGGVKVEKFSTRFGSNYERHTQPNGVETWWKLIKIREL